MKKIKIQGIEYIEFSLDVPVLLNIPHYEIFKESYERYKKAYENDGEIYEGSLDDYANLCAASAMNIGLLKCADIISR